MIDNRSEKHPVEAQCGNSRWEVGGWMSSSSRGRGSAGFSVRYFRRYPIRDGVRDGRTDSQGKPPY